LDVEERVLQAEELVGRHSGDGCFVNGVVVIVLAYVEIKNC